MSPDARQVGGNHYLKLPMQPFQFTLPNGWDGASHTILKYISRHHNVPKDEAIESLRKAYHIVDIILQAKAEKRYVNTALLTIQCIGISDYCSINRLDDLETKALIYLNLWIYQRAIPETDMLVSGVMVQHAIEDILTNRYGVTA